MQIKTPRDIGALVRERRTQLGWSQAKMAKRAGVSRLWIIELEKGKQTAQIGLVLRVLKRVEISLEARAVAPDRRRRR